MFELTIANAAGYLSGRGFDVCGTTELGGGVSNTVILAECRDRRLVIKQSLGRLRVAQEWLADRERVFRESSALKALSGVFPLAAIPEVLFEDRPNCLFGMTAAPAAATTWKTELLSGRLDPNVANAIGRMLAAMISATWNDAAAETQFGDRAVFRQLRLDPYYRAAAARHPDLAAEFDQLLCESARRRVSLVHGDWSPKNFLVHGSSVMAIDFEVIHFGDPAFDAAFLLNHLLLKSMYLPRRRAAFAQLARVFWSALLAGTPPAADWLEPAAVKHLGALMLARVDGKSPAEYLTDSKIQDEVRQRARELIRSPPDSMKAVFEW